MTGNTKIWRAPLAGLASVAMIATMGMAAATANAATGAPKITWVNADGTTYTQTDDEATANNGVIGLDSLKPSGKVDADMQATGWYTAKAIGDGERVQPGTKLTGNVTLYEHASRDYWTVEFVGANGSDPTTVSGVQECTGDDGYEVTIAKGDKLDDWLIPSKDARPTISWSPAGPRTDRPRLGIWTRTLPT